MLARKFLLIVALSPLFASAYPITAYLEMVKVSSVSNAWKNLTLSNSYANPVIACTYNLPSSASTEGSVRARIVGTTIQVKVQRPLNGAVTPSDVYCTVSEAGSYTVPIKYEAHTISSTQTNQRGDWDIAKMVNVTGSKVQNYTQPVVTGQVMSDNNPNFVAFWSNNCSRTNSATNTSICVGKNTAETAVTTPTTETLGYFIAEQAEYTMANAYVKIALGVDTIRGVQGTPPYSYSLPRSYSFATATISAMDGGNGGWAVLYGNSPISTQLNLAIDEDTVGDAERAHTTEQVAYWVMDPINKTYADLQINEVLYRQATGINEFIEFTVLSNGSILNYLVSSQDGTAQNYRLPDVNVSTGDYVILHSAVGTTSSSGGVHHVYTQSTAPPLANGGDDIVLLKPSSTDATTLNGSGTHNSIPVDYISYGSGGDPIPVSVNGATVSWNNSDNARLGGVSGGQSISLTPNGSDSDTSVCWEKTTSGDASACPGFVITRDTDASSFINSQGQDNTASPDITLAKSVLTIYDPYNGASNPKAIPGSVLEYIITATNNGNLAADSGSIKISDVVPANTKLCVIDSGQCKAPYLVDGTPASGLSMTISSAFTPAATPDGEGADSSVNSFTSSTTGAFLPKTGTTGPNFQLRFRVIVK